MTATIVLKSGANMKYAYILVVLVLPVLLTASAQAQQQFNVNLCPNPGFEGEMQAEAGDGMPVKWRTHTGKGNVDFAVVPEAPHSGKRCAHIHAHKPNPSGYWTSPRIPVEGGKKYRLQVWYKSKDVEMSGRGIIFSLNFRREDNSACGWISEYADPFTNPWTLMEFTGHAAPDAAYLNIVMGLADSAGELWLDDIRFVNTGETRDDMVPTDEILARPFPQYWMPDDKSIGLIRGETQPLLFLIQNMKQKKVDHPCIGLLLPAGIAVTGADYRIEPPATGEPVDHEGKQYRRWLCPVENKRHLRKTFDYYRGSLVCLAATLPPDEYQAYYFFTCAQETQQPQPVTIRVLEPLPEPPRLKRYHVGFLLTDAYRAGGKALEGIASLYAHTGMNVCTWSLSPDPTTLGQYFKARGVLRHFLLPGTGVVYNCAYGNRDPGIAMTDKEGKPNFGGLCPTYTANRGEHFEQKPLEEIIAKWIRADAMDGFTINWEPPGAFKLEKYCWCPRCLDAFSKHTGIARDELDRLGPKGIIEKHKVQWARFRAETEGRIAKAYYDKARELETEVGRETMFIPWVGTGRFDPPMPTQTEIDDIISTSGDVEHPFYYRRWIDAYGPFTYTYYDVISQRWRGRPCVTLDRAGKIVRFARAQAPDAPKPVWLGIQGVQKGSHATLCWATTPAQMELEIVCALAQGCEGIYIYTGRGMDGHFYTAASRAVRRAALLEQYADAEAHEDVTLEGKTMKPESVPYVAYARLFAKGDRKLLILAGLDLKRTFAFALKLRGLADAIYRVHDPVSGKILAGKEQWTAAELAGGVSVKLGPGDLRGYVLEAQ